MKLLAIDCCLRLTGAGLCIDGEIIDFTQQDLGRRQSGELPKMTEKILRDNNLDFSDLDYIALTNGPGYFTGIRVGAAYASGLAYAAGAKIIQVSSLEMLAFNCNHEKVLTLIYAGHGFVYASCKNFLESGEYSHEQIKSWLVNNSDAHIISDDFDRIGLNDLNNFSFEVVKPDIKSLCNLACERINLAVSPMDLKILYYRAPQGVNNY